MVDFKLSRNSCCDIYIFLSVRLAFHTVQGCISQKHYKPKLIVDTIGGNWSN